MNKLLSPLGLTLLAVVALLPGIWVLPLVDRDEPRFSHATVEMMDRGEWAVPYFNDEYRFDKPPLTYWWMRANFEVLGINEFGARLHSALSSWLVAILLFFFARRLGLDRKMAFLAGAGWLTALQVLIHSRLAVADMPLILFIVLAMSQLHRVMHGQGQRGLNLLLLTLWFALGFLAKGPLAYAIPQTALLVLFGFFWWKGRKAGAEETQELRQQRTQVWQAQKAVLITLLPSLALVALWGIPALIDTQGAYFGIGIGKHVVERGTGAMNERFFIPGIYYLLIIIPFLLPWTAHLPGTLKKSWRQGDLDTRFLLAWFVAPFLVFSFYATQLPHYILPGYPAFFLLLAFTFRQRVELGRLGRIVRTLALLLPAVLGLLLLIIGLTQTQRGREALDLALLVTLLGGVMLSLAIVGAALLRREKMARVATVSAFLSFSVFLLLATAVARHSHLTLRLRNATGIPSGTLVASGYKEPSLVWYFDDFTDPDKRGIWDFRPSESLTPDEDALTIAVTRRWRIDDESWWPLLTLQKDVPLADDNRAELAALYGAERIAAAERVSGWSPATSSWVEAIVLRPQ
ncbi:ArnT family glycosyltransferase [Roseibacillus ishigakijimensis]|uniref:Glycosyltransferase family 39 protein n=1 Tax=Roseibacillus ishigakijimensis TaxID=454146 RepID=A0A934RM53_9BACT|nr:glycosyltransferase family 39 protein [Roseibacillus ishigakijimensis]MBK1833363.1 glycosyltransferase family 39 protein [Roseibacillus ishigakijimensis]